jgi:hypothetical protein
MLPLKSALLIAMVWALGGCGGSEQPAERTKAPDAAPRRETVFDPLTSTIGRAEGVQNTVDDQAAEQRRRIEEASR